MTKIDEFSRVLGNIEASQEALGKKLDEHCDDDMRRHAENLTAIRELTESIRPIVETVKRVAPVVDRITPIVDAQQRTWLRIGGAVAAVSLILSVFAYLFQLFATAILKKLGWQ